ncbi:alpha/beta hydrolase [Aquibium sp. LZ166]|uniref:Alpha/beta hydrolase n=1 Tax=Aquibium pacificus TaxID=3153579 RepID=A0ABV3SC59_9HYPH
MAFIHPKLRPLIKAAIGQPTIAGLAPSDVRAKSEERARARPKGPDIDRVWDRPVTAEDGHEVPVRIYCPASAQGVVVAMHGGGWIAGSIDTFDDVSRHIANDSGQAVVNVGYRLAPENPFPAGLNDVLAVLRWVARHGKDEGLPGDRLMLLGDSAGANLAAAAALSARDAAEPDILLQVLVYPGLDARMESETHELYREGYMLTSNDVAHTFRTYGVGQTADADDWRVSPLRADDVSGAAPALLISAECDPLRGDAVAYAQKLLEAGVPATHVTYSGVTHLFFGMRASLEASKMAQLQAAAAIRDAARNPLPQ